jgi:signal peptidase
MQIFKKVLNIVIDVLIIIMLIVSALVAGLAIASKNDGVSNILGYVPLSVQSPSMEPEFYEGDLIISKVVDADTDIKVNDIITFATTIEGEKALNTHRVIEIQESEGFLFYVTKGDNNPIPDAEPVIETDVVAVYNTGMCLGGIGTFYDFLTSQTGFFFVILLPLIIFFIYEVIRVIRNLIAYNKEKAYNEAMANASNNSGLSEDEMKLAVEKYLAEQAKQTDNNEEQSASSDETDNANTNNTEE